MFSVAEGYDSGTCYAMVLMIHKVFTLVKGFCVMTDLLIDRIVMVLMLVMRVSGVYLLQA